MAYATQKPPISIYQSEYARLSRLAEALPRSNSDLAEQFFTELLRADVISDDTACRVVRMGSRIRYETGAGETRTVTLVYPHDEDIAADRVSILTPIGVALIGLREGDEMSWRARDGRVAQLRVDWIDTHEPAKADSGLVA